MIDSYDVLVIGGGPAGATAAKTLADRRVKVMLAEKCKLPRYKSCSGMLIKKTLELTQLYFGSSVPIEVACAPSQNKGMVFTDDNGKEYVFAQDGLNVWRSTFDNWLLQQAKQSGAQICDGTFATNVDDMGDCVSVTLNGRKSGTFKFRYVLDCEGAVGAVKRKLLGKSNRSVYTYQTFNTGSIDLDHGFFYAYLQPELSQYDAWFNVKDSMLVLGVAVEDPATRELYYRRFISYMQEKHHLKIDREIKTDKWIMPRVEIGCPIEYGEGRVFFAGEIAGFLNPMGEGISAAMESGYCLASAVADNFFCADAILDQYRKSCASLRDYVRRQWSFTGRLSGTFKDYV